MESRLDRNKIESEMGNFDYDLKKMKAVGKKMKNKLDKSKKREKQLWIALFCVCILGVSSVFQRVLFLNGEVDSRRLP
ncbi:hypothetical protein EJD97_002384 [Solanum chilense]|uniref:Uncharacterized protein n=1 Tax=Solanum chilense TaxID=4083 RepID=A0A6N2APZ3_SOLCI|nr:hypothetical protein EJD97_002384 [Solanum chilense]